MSLLSIKSFTALQIASASPSLLKSLNSIISGELPSLYAVPRRNNSGSELKSTPILSPNPFAFSTNLSTASLIGFEFL